MIPTDAEVREFADQWPGELTTGIPAGIPEAWWLGWLANAVGRGENFPVNWRRVMVLRFRSDWMAGNPKTRRTTETAPARMAVGAVSANVATIERREEQKSILARLADLDEEIQALNQAGADYRQTVAERKALLEKLRGLK